MRHQPRLLVKLAATASLGLSIGCAGGGAPTFLAPENRVAARPGLVWPVLPASGAVAPSPPVVVDLAARSNELIELVDVALTTNPATRQAWQLAQADAARTARAQSAYFPRLEAGVDAGYESFLFQQKDAPVRVDQWEVIPQASLTWTLLDFGRRSGALASAESRLRAANLTSNRVVQDVIFAVARGYYALDAALAMVGAAEGNLARAVSVNEAAEQRRTLGLATLPDVLLTRQTKAKAIYDLESAKVGVSHAQAELAMAIGIPANQPVEIRRLGDLPLPEALATTVDALIGDALADRPDLLAQMARVRAEEAAVEQARADLFPEVYVNAGWGQDLWWYRINDSATDDVDEPSYRAMLGVRWKLFEGFDRWNAIREAEAEAAGEKAALETARLEAVAAIWRVYHDFRAARKKWEYAQALEVASREAYISNRDSYAQGLTTIVELLTAERDLAESLYVGIHARAGLLTTAAELDWVVGARDKQRSETKGRLPETPLP